MISAVVVVVPTGTAGYNTTVIDEVFDFSQTLSAQLSPGVDVDVEAQQVTSLPAGGMWMKVSWNSAPESQLYTNVRTVPGVSLELTTPAIANGKPYTPKYWFKNEMEYELRQEPGHLYAVPDTDPKWNSSTSSWIYPPTNGGVGDMRWTVRSMPDVADFADETYPVGIRTSLDGSNVMDSAVGQWAADSSTPSAPSWQSCYPYKPQMINYVHRNQDGSEITQQGLQFNMHYVQHMWMDIGNSPMPFTWLIAGIILDFPHSHYRHYMLDSGKDPRTYLPTPTEDTVAQTKVIPNSEGLAYRTMLGADPYYFTIQNRNNSFVRTRYQIAPTPRVFFGVFDGNNSMVGNVSGSHGNIFTKAKLAVETNPHRYMVLGRKQGVIGIEYASHMVVFEVRYWSEALTRPVLEAQFNQLRSTWKFSRYT